MPFHEIFWNIGLSGYLIYLLAAIVVGIFIYALYRRYQLWKLGKGSEEFGNVGERIKAFILPGITEGFGHKRILREPYPGIMHLLILCRDIYIDMLDYLKKPSEKWNWRFPLIHLTRDLDPLA